MMHRTVKQDRHQPQPRGAGPVAHRKITAVRVLVAGAVGLLLYYAHAAFVPLAIALLLALILSARSNSFTAFACPAP